MKYVSVIKKDGTLGWKMCEGIILACPAVSDVRGDSARRRDTLSDEKGETVHILRNHVRAGVGGPGSLDDNDYALRGMGVSTKMITNYMRISA